MRLTRRTPPSRAARRSHALAEAGVLLVLALAVTLAACSGDSGDPSAGPGRPTGASEGDRGHRRSGTARRDRGRRWGG